ncbi:DNA polymerase III subunit gamma/tau [Marinicella sediminis]|uniref:DNA polymerase III subunit gamma/tau n=1 Tax=Marinicella sediminis TaxID=1792834 RepID=A0ABV7J694_9GAMM|nr:DNA polymerase III subunit gamma/tau [Marinicella sediminis]
MTYQALARKYRPQNFAEIVGQEHVVQALVNGIENNRLHHAFLFTGTRGVGKTTLARVLAKSLNCLEGISGNPCGVCQHCVEIKEGDFIDLIEVDAASRTGVDDTRNLLENVQYAPNKGQYKIYLIDEVHMFSKSSFNALLKTLEEPPEHVKFLLATTEPDKLPVTVLSRCLQFNLKRLTQKQIGDHLQSLLNKESVDFDERAIQLISRVADGSMRDALSLLDQSLAFGAGAIHFDEIRAMLGTVEQTHVEELLRQVHHHDHAQVLEKLQWFHDMSVDYQSLVDDLCRLMHEVAAIQALGRMTGGSHFDSQVLKTMATELSPEQVQWYYQLIIVAAEQLNYTPDKRISFEMAVIRMLDFEPGSPGRMAAESTEDSGVAHADSAGQSQESVKPTGPQANLVDTQMKPHTQVRVSAEQLQNKPDKPIDLHALSQQNWPGVFERLQLKGGSRELARHLAVLENNEKVLTFAVDQSAEIFMNEKAQKAIRERLLGDSNDYTVKFTVRQEVNSVAQITQQEAARQSAEQDQVDPVVQHLQSQFGAKIIQNKLGD